MQVLAKSPLLALVWLLSACDEPVDCAREPQRCAPVPVQTSAPAPASPAPALLHVPARALADAAPLPVGAPTREEVTAIVAMLQLPAKAKNFAGLKPFITPRLYDTLAPLMAQDSARLWRHLDKFVQAADGGFRTEVESVEADRVQLHLTLPTGDDLRPIAVRQNSVWKLDRF